jgi:alanine-synthesizing transaminase
MKIQLANRIERLPPYVLGRLKQTIYARRQAGADVIDLNMGNPTDAPPDAVIDKLCEAVKNVCDNYGKSNSITFA